MLKDLLWRIILTLLIGLSIFLVIRNAQSHAAKMERKYNELVTETSKKTAEVAAEYKLRKALGEQDAKRTAEASAEQLGAVINNYESILKRKGKEYEQLKNGNGNLDALVIELRGELASHSAGVPEGEAPRPIATEGGGECDTASIREYVEQLEVAAAIETIHYNRCISDLVTNCSITGCE